MLGRAALSGALVALWLAAFPAVGIAGESDAAKGEASVEAAQGDPFANLSFSSDGPAGGEEVPFFEEMWQYVQDHPAPLLVLAVLWLLMLVLHHVGLGVGGAKRLKSPTLVVYVSLFLYVLAAVFSRYSVGFGRVFYLVALTGVTLAAVQAAGVVVVDFVLARRSVKVPAIIRDILVITVFVVALFVVLGNQGVNLTAILASAGFVGIVLGLAMQDTMGNIISGLALQMEKPIDVGDIVRFDQREGRVTEINWRSVKLETSDRETIIVPNTMITKASLVNLCRPTMLLRRHTIVGLPYDVAPNRVKRVAEEALKRIPGVLHEPPPRALIMEYGASAIQYKITYFIEDIPRREMILDEVNTMLWYALRRANISIPFPIQDVFVHEPGQEGEGAQLRDEEFQERMELLASVPFFEPLPAADLEYLARRARVEAFAAREEIVRQGDLGASFFMVREGVAVVRGRDEESGTVIDVARLGRGAHFGEMSLMTGDRRSATVVALDDCEFLVVDREPFREVIHRSPESLERITEIMVARRMATQQELAAKRAERESMNVAEERASLASRIRTFFRM